MRALRFFVAVAEELHFTRAAARLFVAQQALSREIQRLERRLGTPLFVRTTRSVALTPEGERLLPRARALVELHDEILGALAEPARPILVDLMSDGRLTGQRILEAARTASRGIEFRGRYGGGMGLSLRQLRLAEIDVAFGRAEWRGSAPLAGLERLVFRYEPLAVMLPADHPLAALDVVPLANLRGAEVDANPAHGDAPEWDDLMEQFLALSGAVPTGPHVTAIGPDDQSHHLVQQGLPIMTTVDHRDVRGGVIRPIVDPVPLYAWSMVWRGAADGPGVAALRDAATTLVATQGWLERPEGAWLPEPEAAAVRARADGADLPASAW